MDLVGEVMRAAVFRGGRNIRVENVPVPRPGAGDILVKVAYAGICGSDLLSYRGLGPWQHSAERPDRDGHELSGWVAAAGPEVDDIAVGDRVAVEPVHLVSCGGCTFCTSGRTYLCAERGLQGGVHQHSRGFAEYDLVPRDHAYPLPDQVSLEDASILDCYACGVHALHVSDLPAKSPVLILGAGAIGLTLGQVARAAGHRVTVFGRSTASLHRALRAGAADAVYDTADPVEWRRALAEHAGGFGVVFDAAGNADGSLRDAMAFAAPGGRVVVVGVYAQAPAFDPHVAYQRELTVQWSNSYGSCVEGVPDYRRALDLLAAGLVRATELITHRLPLERIGDGFAIMLDRSVESIKVLVEPAAETA